MMPRGIRRLIFTHNKVNVLALKVLPGSRLDALRHWAFRFAQQQIQAQGVLRLLWWMEGRRELQRGWLTEGLGYICAGSMSEL